MAGATDTLGARLMQNFLATLPELGDALWRIIMVNGAVRLATAQNPAIDKLKQTGSRRRVHPGLRHLPGTLSSS
jgi:hypothetical protein